MPLPELTEPSRIALFLDFDGTIVPIAPRPEDVHVDEATQTALALLHDQLGGALAIVTGRDIETIDGFLAPLRVAVAGVHGAVRRRVDGSTDTPTIESEIMTAIRNHLSPFLARHPHLLLEEKHGSLALHYRADPDREADCLAVMETAVHHAGRGEIKRGRCVIEAKLLPGDKGAAIEAFLGEAPFQGRLPVFAGDDVTDEDAFTVVNAAGGVSIKIGDGTTSASYRVPATEDFTAWLCGLARTFEGGRALE